MLEKAITKMIQIEVQSRFVPDQSNRDENHYFFAYQIEIKNLGNKTVQLMSRHWIITDGLGRIEEVRGAGVIGLQPRLEPGQCFDYESFCPLPTPTGTMRGSYQMMDDQGKMFEVEIPEFFLVEPNSFH